MTTATAAYPDLADEIALLEVAVDVDSAMERRVTNQIAQDRAYLLELTKKRSTTTERCEAMSYAIGDGVDGERRFSPEDVLGWIERAIALGCVAPRMGEKTCLDVYAREIVPNAGFRARYFDLERRGEMSLCRLALLIGETRDRGGSQGGDSTRVSRILGITGESTGKTVDNSPTYSLRTFISYELAVKFASALGMSVHDAGV